jgi:hypothetical protein
MQRRVGNREVPDQGALDGVRDVVDVPVDDVAIEHTDRPGPAGLVDAGTDERRCVDRPFDLCVVGGTQLGAVGEEHLHAVVGWRVVTGSDHEPDGGAQRTYRVGEHRRRDHGGHDHRLDAETGEDCGHVVRVDIAVWPGVVADDRPGARADPGPDAGRHATYHDAIHAVRPRPLDAADTGGAEAKPSLEAFGQAPEIAGLDQGLEFGAGDGVGIGLDPQTCSFKALLSRPRHSGQS